MCANGFKCAVVCPHPFSGSSIDVAGRRTPPTLDGETVTLVDGVSEAEVAPDSTTKNHLGLDDKYKTDLNNDGHYRCCIFTPQRNRVVPGTFFYVVAALTT